MEIDTVLDASKDFEKKGKRETCRVLDQLLCHVAKTGETMIPWAQFKTYFLFKLEKVIDDFRASSPDQRGLVNPNVECIPFQDMKDRILKIVNGYNGIPFTIQRLCELLIDPKRNYTGTDKFLRGVEKNVMVVSSVCATSEKNGLTSVNRMNGVVFPGSVPSSVYSDSRNMNGPGTPRPLSRPKLSLSSSPSSNGLPDCSDDKGAGVDQGEGHASDSLESEGETPNSSVSKNKHPEDEDSAEADGREVKRLKFDPDEEEEGGGEERSEGRGGEGEGESCPASTTESSSDAPESSTDAAEDVVNDDKTDVVVKRDGEPADDVTSNDHEPTSTQTESLGGGEEEEEEEEEEGETGEEREAAPGPVRSPQTDGTADPLRQPARSANSPNPPESEDGESGDPVSSSSGGGGGGEEEEEEEEEEGTPSDEPAVPDSPGSTAEAPADGAAEAGAESLVTTAAGEEEAMDQD